MAIDYSVLTRNESPFSRAAQNFLTARNQAMQIDMQRQQLQMQQAQADAANNMRMLSAVASFDEDMFPSVFERLYGDSAPEGMIEQLKTNQKFRQGLASKLSSVSAETDEDYLAAVKPILQDAARFGIGASKYAGRIVDKELERQAVRKKPYEAGQVMDDRAMATFGKRYGDLSQDERKAIVGQVEEYELSKAAAMQNIRTAAQAKIKRAGIATVRTQLNQLDRLSRNLNTTSIEDGTLGRLAKGGYNMVTGFFGSNKDASLYMDQKTAFVGSLQKAFGGEVGVLTNQDIARVTASLPSFFDSKEVRDAKMAFINKMNDAADDAYAAIVNGASREEARDAVGMDNIISEAPTSGVDGANYESMRFENEKIADGISKEHRPKSIGKAVKTFGQFYKDIADANKGTLVDIGTAWEYWERVGGK